MAELLAFDSTTVDQNKRSDWPIMHLDQSRRLENHPALKFKINSLVHNENKIVLCIAGCRIGAALRSLALVYRT